MIEMLARFDRTPLEEIRVSLVREERRASVEVRVYGKSGAGKGGPAPAPVQESVTVPIELFDTLVGALHIVDAMLRKRGLLQRERTIGRIEAAEVAQFMRNEITPTPPPRLVQEGSEIGAWGTKHLGRADVRLVLDCPIEYWVRSKQPRAQDLERKRGRTKDISRTGAQVLLPERISVLTMLQVTIHLPMGDVLLPCEVVWSQRATPAEIARNGCRHGLRFTAVSPREAGLLRELIGQKTANADTSSE